MERSINTITTVKPMLNSVEKMFALRTILEPHMLETLINVKLRPMAKPPNQTLAFREKNY